VPIFTVRSSAPEESGSSASDVAAARKYQLLMELGRGGTAVISAGIARGIGGFTKLVVLKTVKEEFLAEGEAVRMFVNEARLSARMNHPNVVQVYEVYRHNRLPVIVMEYLDGQSLARVLGRAFRDPRYRTDLGVAILCKVLGALAYAHTLTDYDGRPLRIVHRDVSPHNVMVTYDGQVKLVDFGIAKLGVTAEETRTGVIKGKIGYMAPEQVEGGPLDHRADLFAAGVMLWEMVARRRMWGARGEAEIVRCLVLDEVPSLLSVEPDVDPELAGICDRALSVDPAERFPSAAEFQTALEAYLARRGVVIRQRDIADLVNRTCADLRATSAQRLQAELAKCAADAPGWEDALGAFDDLGTSLPERAPVARAWLMLASALLTLGTAAGVYRWLGELPSERAVAKDTAALDSVASSQIAPTPASVAPMTIRLKVAVEPAAATVFLDGRPLLGVPPAVVLAPDELEHELRVEAEGFEPMLRRVQLATDTELALVLRPRLPAPEPLVRPPEVPARKRARRETPVREPTPAAASAAQPPAGEEACNSPYYIDSGGVKQYRRECL
jgi:eukaryotic-like serine/threonine-protein kinase